MSIDICKELEYYCKNALTGEKEAVRLFGRAVTQGLDDLLNEISAIEMSIDVKHEQMKMRLGVIAHKIGVEPYRANVQSIADHDRLPEYRDRSHEEPEWTDELVDAISEFPRVAQRR